MNPAAVTFARSLVKISIRLFAIVVVAVVMWYMLRHLTILLRPGSRNFSILMEKPVVYAYNNKMPVGWAASWLVLAALLFVFQNQIARVIVPRATRACHECGYDLRALKASRCPECGTDIVPPHGAGK